MAAVTFATIADYNLHQLRGSEDDPQLQFRLNSARDHILRCLYAGRYPVSTILAVVAAGDPYSILKELNIVMAHLRLITGAAESRVTDSAGQTYIAYRDWIKETLKAICMGEMPLTSDSGDSVIAPPKYDQSPKILGDDRKNGLVLKDPLNYTESTPLQEDS